MSGPDWYRWYPSKWLTGVMLLTPEERGVYDTIINIILDRGSCPDSEDDLVRICNCQRRKLRRIIDTLIERGKIERFDGCFAQVRAEKERKSSETFSKVQQNRALKRWHGNDLADAIVGNANHNHNHKKDSNVGVRKQPTEQTRPNGHAKPDVDAEFESWWLLWTIPGTKRSRGQALKAYRTARKTTERHILAAALEQHVRRWVREGTDLRYIPHPATWLNGERWRDDILGAAPQRRRRGNTAEDLLNYTGEDIPQ